jgi:hypothetical protein
MMRREPKHGGYGLGRKSHGGGQVEDWVVVSLRRRAGNLTARLRERRALKRKDLWLVETLGHKEILSIPGEAKMRPIRRNLEAPINSWTIYGAILTGIRETPAEKSRMGGKK